MIHRKPPEAGAWKRAGLMGRSAPGVLLALGVAGLGGVACAPPAQAKAAPARPAPLKLSKAFQAAALESQKANEAAKANGDIAGAMAKLDAAFAVIANDDDRLMAGNLAVGLGSTANDPALQRRGIEAMLQSGKLPPEDLGKFSFFLGNFQYQARQFGPAFQSLLQARRAGFHDSQLDALLYDSASRSGDLEAAFNLAKEDIAAAKASGGAAPAIALRSVLVSAYHAKQLDRAYEFASLLVTSYPEADNWNLATVVVRELASLPAQDNIDLMRLMFRTGALKEGRDYMEYLQNATGRVGVLYPGEVLSVARDGLAKGLVNQSDVAEYLTNAQAAMASDRISLPGQERDARAAGAGAVSVLAAADAFLSYGEPAKAEQLYNLALAKPGVDNGRALTRLGIALLDQGKFAEATAAFDKVTGPRQSVAHLWSIYARQKMAPATATVPAASAP